MLDICRDLGLPILGFRRAVANFARKVRPAAWQEGFAKESDALFRAEVEAEVERLGHAVRENRSYTEIGLRALRHGGRGLAGASSLADVSAAAPVGVVGGPLVKTLLDKRRRSRVLPGKVGRQSGLLLLRGGAGAGREAGRATDPTPCAAAPPPLFTD